VSACLYCSAQIGPGRRKDAQFCPRESGHRQMYRRRGNRPRAPIEVEVEPAPPAVVEAPKTDLPELRPEYEHLSGVMQEWQRYEERPEPPERGMSRALENRIRREHGLPPREPEPRRSEHDPESWAREAFGDAAVDKIKAKRAERRKFGFDADNAFDESSETTYQPSPGRTQLFDRRDDAEAREIQKAAEAASAAQVETPGATQGDIREAANRDLERAAQWQADNGKRPSIGPLFGGSREPTTDESFAEKTVLDDPWASSRVHVHG
jgi:hypothetical protein